VKSPWITITTPEPNDRPAPQDRRAATADLSWVVWTAIGIGAIWVAFLLISLFAPDLVSGAQQEHLPVAAFMAWAWRGRRPGLAVGDGPAAGCAGSIWVEHRTGVVPLDSAWSWRSSQCVSSRPGPQRHTDSAQRRASRG
jgi:hypothetical protein